MWACSSPPPSLARSWSRMVSPVRSTPCQMSGNGRPAGSVRASAPRAYRERSESSVSEPVRSGSATARSSMNSRTRMKTLLSA